MRYKLKSHETKVYHGFFSIKNMTIETKINSQSPYQP